MKNYGFGVDIGGTTCKIGLFETTGVLVDKWEIPTRKENNGEYVLPDVADSIEKKMEEKKIGKDDLQGIGIGVPGPVTSQSIVQCCVNLGWGQVNVAEVMEKRMGCKIKVGNDANVAALGEMWQGGGKGHRNVVMVTLGTGVGGGIIVDGKIVAGSHGAGGEIGHMMVDESETETCGCGKRGCLEQYASATGVVRLAKRKLSSINEETSLKKYQHLSAKNVFDEAKAGDKIAVEIVETMADILGTALAGIACVVDPEVFVIGGGVSKAGNIVTDNVKKYYSKKTFHACKDAEFALAKLGNDAGMYGCMQMILE